MKKITINKSNLNIMNHESGEEISIVSCNGSGLYKGINKSGEEVFLTRGELKKIADIESIDEVIEMINNKEHNKVYTDDMMNFIDEIEYNQLGEYKDDYEKVEFVYI